MPRAVDGIWTPEEAEQAFTQFGNLFLQVIDLQRRFGDRPDANPAATARPVVQYLQGLSRADFIATYEFLEALPELVAAIRGFVDMELLRRAITEEESTP